jgi:Protein of unknown function (DUF1257)
MSHFVAIKTSVRDVNALKKACEELGLELLEKTTARGFASNTLKGDYVIRLKGPYDIALNLDPESGSYGLSTDWYAGHVEKEVGKDYSRLLQLYAIHKTQIEARKKGLSCRRQQLGDGSIKISIGGI